MSATSGAAGFNAVYAPAISAAVIGQGLEIYKACYFGAGLTGAQVDPPNFNTRGLIDPNLGVSPSPVPVNTDGLQDFTLDNYADGSPCNIMAAMTDTSDGGNVAKWVPIAPLRGLIFLKRS